MCGITGVMGPLEAMTESLWHRGPDSVGYWEDPRVSLGVRRLAIVDVQTGEQPVFNEDGAVAVVFNGEIYNYVELRERLQRSGHRFSTDHSDTEVIVHLYEERGLDFVHDLNGMFAIALWDARKNTLVLVRDRLGIKPLYFAPVAGGIVFGSEPKALLKHPRVSRTPDLKAIHHYLSLKNVPAPMSAFADIRQLRAGELAVCSDDGIDSRRWWRTDFTERPVLDRVEAAREIRALLEDSVRLQMRSDVPIGAYLSGGVDSSSVLALLARLGAGDINTFTLVYDGKLPHKEADRHFAQQVARQYGTRHHEHLVTFNDLPEKLDGVVGSFDEPFSGVISTYFLTEEIGRYVKVALSGDGADEIFGSYLPHRLAAPLAAYAAGTNDPDLLIPFENDLPRLQALISRGDEASRRMGLYLLDDKQKADLYSPMMREATAGASTEEMTRAVLQSCQARDPLNRALSLEIETLLPDQVLAFVDRLSMAHSVEVRPPFLDHRLVEFAASLPGAMKIERGQVKQILKEAIKDLLPANLLARPKEGFLMPINEWLLGDLEDYVRAHLAPTQLQRHGLFGTVAIENMLDEHYSGVRRQGNQIWNILMLQLWWNRYISA